jgi:hypothetical protein
MTYAPAWEANARFRSRVSGAKRSAALSSGPLQPLAGTHGYCMPLVLAGATWTPRKPARSTACFTSPEALASSMNSLT